MRVDSGLPRVGGCMWIVAGKRTCQEVRRWIVSASAAVAAVSVYVAVTSGVTLGQEVNASLAARCSVIVRGKVVKTNASDEVLVAPSSRTVVVSVEKMEAGAEFAGDQSGKVVTVILSRPETVKEGEEAVFCGNPLFVGKSLTIADEGEVPLRSNHSAALPALQRGAQMRQDNPIADRLAVASLVFQGVVGEVRAVELEAPKEGERRASASPSEHDPEWHAASVQVTKSIRGGEAGETVTVIFAASRDITWFNSPKLKQGQEAVFLVHAPMDQEKSIYQASGLTKFLEKQQKVFLVTEPFDVLRPTEEAHVRSLLATAKETKQ
jgi:hypothetical protein